MAINHRLIHTPDGVKDYMPIEFAAKAAVERRLEAVFDSHAFARVSSPMFEYADVFDEKGSVTQTSIYKFIDRDGSVLALRSDMTPQIARMAATLCHQEDVPLRFSYVENAFRYNESYQGKLKEFTQAGVELIGINSDAASAEVIALAISSLLAVGLKDFRIDIGQVQFFQGILEEGGFDEDACHMMRKSIVERDYVAVETAARFANVPDNVRMVLSDLPLLIGGAEVLQKARSLTTNTTALSALANLENIFDILCACGMEKYIAFDLSMVGHLDYYTGIIFRGYAYGTGSSVIDGGRYDHLTAHFGVEYPAVGFSIKIGMLLSALAAQNSASTMQSTNDTTLLAYTKEGMATAMSAASELRGQGLRIENSLQNGNLAEALQYAKSHGIGGILFFEDTDNVVMADVATGVQNRVKLSALLAGKGATSCGI